MACGTVGITIVRFIASLPFIVFNLLSFSSFYIVLMCWTYYPLLKISHKVIGQSILCMLITLDYHFLR